jgi:hypothetical protein
VAYSKWFSKRALIFHLAIIVWFPGCLVAAWWQITVALAGDSLGWLYSVEWPVFAIFGAVFWWNLIHDDPEQTGHKGLILAKKRLVESNSSSSPAQGIVTEGVSSHDTEQDLDLRLSGIDVENIRRIAQEDEDMAAYNEYLAQFKAPRTNKDDIK